MLGINSRRDPIGGEVAERIRAAIERVATGQLNEQEKASVERSKRIRSLYKATWIDLDGKEIYHED